MSAKYVGFNENDKDYFTYRGIFMIHRNDKVTGKYHPFNGRNADAAVVFGIAGEVVGADSLDQACTL